MPQPLPRSFYERDPRTVARELLGKVLLRKVGRRLIAGRIVETEAYLGARDLAAHAAAGMTPRNAVLFGPAGHAYVYFTYGMYHCMNISCEREGRAGCVLVRALEPLSGLEEMALGRHIALPDEPSERTLKLLTSGPGRLCQALHITRVDDNGKDVTSRRSDLQVVNDGYVVKRSLATERIGITKDAHLKLRYVIAGNPFVSGQGTKRKAE
jgi:DNA-3-methyladenine glycosylase